MLRGAGHDASTVIEQHLEGRSDTEVASLCREEGLVLITLDSGFADIRTYPPAEFPGMIVLRLRRQDKCHVLEMMKRVIPLLSRESIEHFLWIVEEKRIRVRG